MIWDSISEEGKIIGFGALAIVAISAIVVGASQPTHKQVMAPDGAAAWLVTCSTPGGCLEESSATCPKGYQVVDANEKRGTLTTYTNVGVGAGNSVGVPTTSETYEGEKLIRCKL